MAVKTLLEPVYSFLAFSSNTHYPPPPPPNTHTHTNTHMYAHSNMWCFLWKSHSTWHCTSHTQLPSTTQAATSAIVSLRVVTFWHTARATAPVTHHLHQWIWYWYWYSGRQTRQLAAALGGVSRWGRGGGGATSPESGWSLNLSSPETGFISLPPDSSWTDSGWHSG